MKTIEIQNCTEYRDNLFKVFINGEKHIVRYQSKIQVSDDKPFKIKAKYLLTASLVYTFEPKDNTSLQILRNRMPKSGWTILAWVIAYIFGVLVMKMFDNIFYAGIFLLVALIYEVFRCKRFFVIREVIAEKNNKKI